MAAPRRADGKRRSRLSRSGDFDRVYREGRSHGNRFLVLYSFPRQTAADGENLRLGITVSRKVGGAVDRNAVKRSIRESFWELAERIDGFHDFVIVARPDAKGLVERDGTPGITAELDELLCDAGFKRASAEPTA